MGLDRGNGEDSIVTSCVRKLIDMFCRFNPFFPFSFFSLRTLLEPGAFRPVGNHLVHHFHTVPPIRSTNHLVGDPFQVLLQIFGAPVYGHSQLPSAIRS